jgi:hypothetical protein
METGIPNTCGQLSLSAAAAQTRPVPAGGVCPHSARESPGCPGDLPRRVNGFPGTSQWTRPSLPLLCMGLFFKIRLHRDAA